MNIRIFQLPLQKWFWGDPPTPNTGQLDLQSLLRVVHVHRLGALKTPPLAKTRTQTKTGISGSRPKSCSTSTTRISTWRASQNYGPIHQGLLCRRQYIYSHYGAPFPSISWNHAHQDMEGGDKAVDVDEVDQL